MKNENLCLYPDVNNAEYVPCMKNVQLTFTRSKLTSEILKESLKYVQS